MEITKIDGHILRKAFILGANELEKNKEYLNELNVFPVPDGDTGANMAMTAYAAAVEVEKLDTNDIHAVAKAAASGSLRGARGNSGVILSQLFRGFAKGLEGKKEIDAKGLSEAFVKASEAAYKAVMKPKEGTVLTIARALADASVEAVARKDDIRRMLKRMIIYAYKVLAKTQFMLPELKEAGVVDAGAQGFLYVIEGTLKSISVKDEDAKLTIPSKATTTVTTVAPSNMNIEFGYCTEFIIETKNKKVETIETELKKFLDAIGDSIVVVGDGNIVKVHVHTNNPGKALEKAITYGELINIKIDNMREQADEVSKPKIEKPHKKTGIVATSVGGGFKELFASMGVDEIIEGGQTMNPSTDTFLTAIDDINADNVIILPNNKNIILAAEQAAKMYKGDKKIFVIPTKDIPQGLAAVVSLVPDLEMDVNMKNMERAISSISTGQITYAIKDTSVGGNEIKIGDILCMLNGKIVNVENSVLSGAKALIDTVVKEQSPEIITVYFGEEAKKEETAELVSYVEENFDDIEIEVYEGGQPIYYYIISAE